MRTSVRGVVMVVWAATVISEVKHTTDSDAPRMAFWRYPHSDLRIASQVNFSNLPTYNQANH